jgi:uncharacterized protein (TIGR02266 family)
MATPEDGDTRRTRRIEAAFRVRYRSLDQLVVALTHDLSRGGLFMRTARYLPVNAIVRVHLELPDEGGEMPIVCRVAYVRDEAESARVGKPPGMGLEFLDLDPERMAQLTQFVTERTSPGVILPRRRLNVLVVDDEPLCRAPVVAALRDRGDTVREANDGLEALSACLHEPPDLVISDVKMPRMDGWQLTRMLRARPSTSRLPVVLFTTLIDDEARLRGYRMGVDDYIGKTVPADEILARVDRVVSRVSLQRSRERHTLRGDLSQVTLASVLSFLALEQKTGILFLVGQEGAARIYLRGGVPVRVEIGDNAAKRIDDPELLAVLGWTRGQFEFANAEVSFADELGTTVNELLLEHARRSDESAQ